MKVRAVFPGTFDPIHYGHIDIALRASRVFDEVIIAVFNRPMKSILFSAEERIQLVEQSFIEYPQVKVMGYGGLTVEFCRQIHASVIVRGLRVFSDFEYEFRMALANNRLAPEIEIVPFITHEQHTFLASSTVREISSMGGDVTSMVTPHVAKAMVKKFKELGDGQQIVPQTSLRD